MYRNSPRLALALLLWGLLFSADAAVADEVFPLQVKVYKTQHVNAGELAGTLNDVLKKRDPRLRIIAHESSTSIVIQAPATIQVEVSRLLEALDVPASATDSVSQVIPLRYVTAKQVEKVVALQLTRKGRVAFSRHPNSVYINDTQEAVQRVASVLAQIDVPRPTLRVRCWILGHGGGAAVKGHETVGVLEHQLTTLGLTGYGVISEAAVTTIESMEFSLQQSFQARALRELGLSGRLQLLDEGRVASLELQLSLRLQYKEADDKGSILLHSTFTAPVGHFVVAGLAPTGDENSKPVVVVIRVEK